MGVFIDSLQNDGQKCFMIRLENGGTVLYTVTGTDKAFDSYNFVYYNLFLDDN